jgi:hypothetical protein
MYIERERESLNSTVTCHKHTQHFTHQGIKGNKVRIYYQPFSIKGAMIEMSETHTSIHTIKASKNMCGAPGRSNPLFSRYSEHYLFVLHLTGATSNLLMLSALSILLFYGQI